MKKGTWILLTIPLLALAVAVMGAYVDRITAAMNELEPGTQLGQRLTWHGDRWAPTLIVWAGISSASGTDPQDSDYFSYEASPGVRLTIEANRAATSGEYFVFDIPSGYEVSDADQDGTAVTLTKSGQRWYIALTSGTTPEFSLLIELDT